MNRKINKFLKLSKKMGLSEKERSLLEYRIKEFMSFNPIRGEVYISQNGYYFSIFTFKNFVRGVALTLIVLIAGGAGITYASNEALPGSKLYPIKINIRENIEERLAFTSETKINVQSSHVEKRLNEARKLAQTNNLTEENKIIVRTNLEKNVEKVAKNIENLKEEGNIEKALRVTSQISPILEVHREMLVEKSLKTKGDENDELIEAVDMAIKRVVDAETKIIEQYIDNQEKIEELINKNTGDTNTKIADIVLKEEKEKARAKNEILEKEDIENAKEIEVAEEASISENTDSAQKTSITEIIEEISGKTSTEIQTMGVVTETITIIKTEIDVEKRIEEIKKVLQQIETERVNKNYKEALTLSIKAKRLAKQLEIFISMKKEEKIQNPIKTQVIPTQLEIDAMGEVKGESKNIEIEVSENKIKKDAEKALNDTNKIIEGLNPNQLNQNLLLQ